MLTLVLFALTGECHQQMQQADMMKAGVPNAVKAMGDASIQQQAQGAEGGPMPELPPEETM